MLDSFEIITTSGIVLWSKSFAPISSSIVNSLIRDVFIEEKIPHAATAAREDASAAHNPPYKKDKYTIKWTQAKDLGLVFVVSRRTPILASVGLMINTSFRPSTSP